jgi:hypothetical protein
LNQERADSTFDGSSLLVKASGRRVTGLRESGGDRDKSLDLAMYEWNIRLSQLNVPGNANHGRSQEPNAARVAVAAKRVYKKRCSTEYIGCSVGHITYWPPLNAIGYRVKITQAPSWPSLFSFSLSGFSQPEGTPSCLVEEKRLELEILLELSMPGIVKS